MEDLPVPGELAELADAVGRLAAAELAGQARQAERDGRWPLRVLDALDGLQLGGLDLPLALGGAGAGCLAKVVVLEALAAADAGGLPAADQPGQSGAAAVLCPDRTLARSVLEPTLGRQAGAALVVVPADEGGDGLAPAVQWAPSWPPLSWVWESCGDRLRLFGPGGDSQPAPGPAPALAFAASGAASWPAGGFPLAGDWMLPAGTGVGLRGRARLWGAAVAVGIARSALEATIAYATERVVFGRPIAHHQGNAFDLAVAAATVHGSHLALRDAARRYDDAGADPAPEDLVEAGFWATAAWVETMEAAFRVTDLGIQLLGGHGFLLDHLAEKRFREARMLAQMAGGRDVAADDLAGATLEVTDW